MNRSTQQLVIHQPKRRPSLRNLAQMIGVSHTAVARALRNDPSISKDLRKRVQEVAQREGYMFSDVTQGLITGWSGTIGVVLPTLTSPWVGELAAGISEALWEDQTVPMVLSSELDPTREEQMLNILGNKRASGVIIMPCREDRDQGHFIHLLNRHTPIVALDSPLPQIDAPLVSTDDHKGGAMATRKLIDRGHRHIVHVACAVDNPQAARRREFGYCQAMEQAGLEPDLLYAPRRHNYMVDLLAQLEDYFQSEKGKRTTAVFAFNNMMAYCVYVYAQKNGRTVGKDLDVIGYGQTNSVWGQVHDQINLIRPTLASVEQHADRIGRTAVDVMRRMVAGKPVPRETLIEPDYVPGESCPD